MGKHNEARLSAALCYKSESCYHSFCSGLINKGCLLETNQKHGLIDWARKGPISKDKCPFLAHILSQVRAFMTRAHAIVHGSSWNLKLKLTR